VVVAVVVTVGPQACGGGGGCDGCGGCETQNPASNPIPEKWLAKNSIYL